MFSPLIYNINVSTGTVLYSNACLLPQDELTGPQQLVALRVYYVATVFIDDRRRWGSDPCVSNPQKSDSLQVEFRVPTVTTCILDMRVDDNTKIFNRIVWLTNTHTHMRVSKNIDCIVLLYYYILPGSSINIVYEFINCSYSWRALAYSETLWFHKRYLYIFVFVSYNKLIYCILEDKKYF